MRPLGRCQVDVTDEEMEDFELQRAMEEVRRLDEILSEKICKGEETRRQRKELNAKLWQDFLVDTVFVFTLLTNSLNQYCVWPEKGVSLTPWCDVIMCNLFAAEQA